MATHVHILSAKRCIFLAYLLCLSSNVFAGDLTFVQAKKKIQAIVDSESNVSKQLLDFAANHKLEAYATKEDWYNTNKWLVVESEKDQGDYFANLCTVVGKRMYYHKYYEEGFYYLYKADKSIKDQPPVDKEFLPFFHESIGLSFFYYRRYDEAKSHFLAALRSKTWTVHERIGLLNSVGLVYRDVKDIDSARYYFTLAINEAKKQNDKGWIGVISGNLGHLLYLQGDYKAALPLITYDYESGQKINQIGSSINAAELLIQINIEQGNIAEAEKILKRIEELIKDLPYNIDESRVLYKARLAVYQANGDYKAAFESYRMMSLYQDTIRARKTEENLKKMEFQIDFEQKQSELNVSEQKQQFNQVVIYFLIALSGLMILIFIMVIRGMIKRRKREQLLAQFRRERVQRELEMTEQEMRSLLNNLIEKNEIVEQLTSEIESFQNNPDSAFNEERAKMLSRMQSITILTDDDWLEFKKLFDVLNPNFFNKLISHAPDLTNAEIRLVTLIKLNLSNLEMSRVLGISPDSVRKTSLRLRKKWNIEQQDELVKFVLSL